jgi:hypothetical protein
MFNRWDALSALENIPPMSSTMTIQNSVFRNITDKEGDPSFAPSYDEFGESQV